MAKRSKKTKNSVDSTVAVETANAAETTTTGNDAPNQQEQNTQMPQITLTKRMTEKSGNTSYSRPGVKASVYFNKNMFKGEPPETIELIADNLTEPGDIVAKVSNPEKAAEKAAKLAEQAEKARVKAEKLAEKMRKAQEFADKLAAKAAGV